MVDEMRLDNVNVEEAKYQRRYDASHDKWNAYIFIVGQIAVLSSYAYGYNISAIDSPFDVFANCVPDVSRSYLYSCVVVGTSWKYVAAGFCAGGLIGALCTGFLANMFGRKRVLIGQNLFSIIGVLLLALASNLSMMILGRLFIGIGSGICTVVVPMYLAEISPDNIRGTVCIMHQVAIVLGITIAQALAFPLSNSSTWRLYFLFPILFSVIQLVLLPFCPESPKFLSSKGNSYGASESLKKLRKLDDVSAELNHLETVNATESSRDTLSIPRIFMLQAARKSLLIGIAYHAIQQFSGINTVFFFSTSIFEDIGIPKKLVSMLIGILNASMTGVSVLLMDRAGRRPLALSSTAAMAVGCFGIVASLLLKWNILCLLFIFIYVGGFAVGLGPVPWVILGDIFPSFAVDAGVTIAIATNWTAVTLVSIFSLSLMTLMGNYLFLLFALFLLSFFTFNYIYVPETKGQPAGFL